MIETSALPRRIEPQNIIYQDRYQTLQRVVAEFDGFRKEYHVSDHGDRSALLVVCDGQVLFVRQYRLLVNAVALEIPGGKVEEGEAPAATAVRECLEESGILAHDPKPLLCYHPCLDIMRNYTHIHYAESCTDQGGIDPERRLWLPIGRSLEKVFAGQLADVMTMVALLAYRALKERR